ncbi:RNA polymerase sigma24 factor [Cellulomonas algicola]|uniref:RNA polymerase sigma24 factor n=1 Tax=Cellulomonas algicola TaxID=2071633 RepID=A0A401V4L5_9CELL|nr:sigma-70 family RNA polymerase sigma factor [Cellulomonas algicola]GCD21811.1 RNA polymerase sigma24 factor [Cellulomonas algicola]
MPAWEQVLDELLRTRGAALVRYATMLTGDSRSGEDLVQDAVVRCFTRRYALREAHAAESYVRRTILTLFVEEHRRRRRWGAVQHLLARADESPGPEPTSSARLDVQSAVATLPPRQRAVVVLRFYDDLTVPEIARTLGIADGTVKRYLSEATERLERLLGPLQDARDDVSLIDAIPERSSR